MVIPTGARKNPDPYLNEKDGPKKNGGKMPVILIRNLRYCCQ
jgi:hypothetical protein